MEKLFNYLGPWQSVKSRGYINYNLVGNHKVGIIQKITSGAHLVKILTLSQILHKVEFDKLSDPTEDDVENYRIIMKLLPVEYFNSKETAFKRCETKLVENGWIIDHKVQNLL